MTNRAVVLFSTILLILLVPLDAYKILVSSPSTSKSHLISNARVADALAKDGHDVTILEIEYGVPLGSLNASKLSKVWRIPGQFLRFKMDGDLKDLQSVLVKMSFEQLTMVGAVRKYFFFTKFMSNFVDACEKLITTQKDHLDGLKAQKFDLLIGEHYDFCSAGLAHLLGIPTFIVLSSCPIQENTASIFGLPTPSSWVPTLQSDRTDKMSLVGRLQNLIQQTLVTVGVGANSFAPLTNIFRKHYGADFPDILGIVKNSPFIFVNVDEFVDFPRPIFSNIVYIGGLGMDGGAKNVPELEDPFEGEMLKGTKGVVLFSMGSIIQSGDLPENFRWNIFDAFSHFPDYHFIVRVDKKDNLSMQLANGMENVFLAGWLPQIQLLRHPRLKLFISHGGYNSLMETAMAGVPLIAMGFFADQFRNARVAERNGWALAFDKMALLEGSGEFRDAIGKILRQPEYNANAKRIQRILATKPFSAEERLQKSIRFLELNGGLLPELLPQSRNMGTFALYNLDLILLGLMAVAILLASIALLAKFIWKRILFKNGGKEGRKTEKSE